MDETVKYIGLNCTVLCIHFLRERFIHSQNFRSALITTRNENVKIGSYHIHCFVPTFRFDGQLRLILGLVFG